MALQKMPQHAILNICLIQKSFNNHQSPIQQFMIMLMGQLFLQTERPNKHQKLHRVAHRVTIESVFLKTSIEYLYCSTFLSK